MNEPIWHKPAWITAIAGMISAFITIPGELSEYLVKRQEITAASLENQFNIVNQTLAQQGTERVFVLRYLSQTLSDKNAKKWAEEEVIRLDDAAELQIQIADAERRLNEEISKNVDTAEQVEQLRKLSADRDKLLAGAGLGVRSLDIPPLQAFCYQEDILKPGSQRYSVHCHTTLERCKTARGPNPRTKQSVCEMVNLSATEWRPRHPGFMDSWYEFRSEPFGSGFPQLPK